MLKSFEVQINEIADVINGRVHAADTSDLHSFKEGEEEEAESDTETDEDENNDDNAAEYNNSTEEER